MSPRVEIPAPAWAANLMQDAAEGLTGDPLANCVLIAQTRQGDQLVVAATPWDDGEIRGLMFRAAAALPTS